MGLLVNFYLEVSCKNVWRSSRIERICKQQKWIGKILQIELHVDWKRYREKTIGTLRYGTAGL